MQAATVLQKAWRRFVAQRQRKITEVERQSKEAAARMIQSSMRLWLWRRTLSKMRFLHKHMSLTEQRICEHILLKREVQLSTLLPLIRMLNSLYQVRSSMIGCITAGK